MGGWPLLYVYVCTIKLHGAFGVLHALKTTGLGLQHDKLPLQSGDTAVIRRLFATTAYTEEGLRFRVRPSMTTMKSSGQVNKRANCMSELMGLSGSATAVRQRCSLSHVEKPERAGQ